MSIQFFSLRLKEFQKAILTAINAIFMAKSAFFIVIIRVILIASNKTLICKELYDLLYKMVALREQALHKKRNCSTNERDFIMMNLPLNVDFSGKVVVITGATGQICSAMVRAFAQCGAKVAAMGRNEAAVKKLADEVKADGFICEGYTANVLDKEALEAAHQQILADLGPCDILVNGAGGNNPRATTDNEYHHEAWEGCQTFFDLEPDAVDSLFKLNVQGTLLPVQVFAKDMVEKQSGCILNISSMNAFIPLTKIPAYSGAKAAISNFTKWLATHFAGSGIRCNAIAPGFLISAQNKALLFNEDGTPTARSTKILNGTPSHRFVEAEEMLGATLFLCNDKSASAITGVILPVDAGFSAYSGV